MIRRELVLVIAALLPLAVTGASQETHPVTRVASAEPAILKDVTGIYVSVEDFRPEFRHIGLSTDDLRSDVTARLQQVGAPVIDETEFSKSPTGSTLYVNVAPLACFDGASTAYSIQLQLVDKGILMRTSHGTLVTDLVSWRRDYIGISSNGRLVSDVRFELEGLVRQFVNDYRSSHTGK